MSLEEPNYLKRGLVGWKPPAKDADSLHEKRLKLEEIRKQINSHALQVLRWEEELLMYQAGGSPAIGLQLDIEKKRKSLNGWVKWAAQLQSEIAQESRRLEVESNTAIEFLK